MGEVGHSMELLQFDRIRIFIENPLQNTNVLHIKMKMPQKVFCMRVNRAGLNLD